MTKWISIQSAAEKYGTTEERIYFLIRYRYITFSYVDDSSLGGDYKDKLLMICEDGLEETLELNAVEALKAEADGDDIVRIPLKELNDILQINDSLREANKVLQMELDTIRQKKAGHETFLKRLGRFSSLIVHIYSRLTARNGGTYKDG